MQNPPCSSAQLNAACNIFLHLAAVLPRKCDFTMKMLYMHHMIPIRYVYASGGFYSSPFAPVCLRRQPNHQTLPWYLSYSALYDRLKTSKSRVRLYPGRAWSFMSLLYLCGIPLQNSSTDAAEQAFSIAVGVAVLQIVF